MSDSLTASYAHCQRLVRRAASSFFLTFYLLPGDKRRAMAALYSYLRHTDDLGDEASPVDVRRARLAQWRAQVEQQLRGDATSGAVVITPQTAIFPALVDTLSRYKIPHRYLLDVIDGVEMDLDTCRYDSFDALRDYCYRVASVVGLSCIHIWGFTDPAAEPLAVKCGLAFQLTNILRDLKEDAARDRVYLPQEDLRQFGYSEELLLASTCNGAFRRLVQFEVERADALYRESAALGDYLAPDGRRVFAAMHDTYHRLLAHVGRRPESLLRRRLRLSLPERLSILARSVWGRSPASHRDRGASYGTRRP
jgi:phytoene synthase